MTFLELEVLCVKNVARDSNSGFNIDTYEDFASNPQYADYINNVDDDINQAIARLVTSEAIPYRSFETEFKVDPKNNNKFTTIDISSIQQDFYKLKKVLFYNLNGAVYVPKFTKISSTKLLIERPKTDGVFLVSYAIFIPQLNHDINGQDDLFEKYGITDNLINSFVLNFTKAKLWESEEPGLCQKYMGYAENYLSAFDNQEDSLSQETVDTYFGY